MSSVSDVYELPTGSPRFCVKVRYDDHTATHCFYDERIAQGFQEYAAKAGPDKLDEALAVAEQVLAGELTDGHPTAVHALAELAVAVRWRMRELGRA